MIIFEQLYLSLHTILIIYIKKQVWAFFNDISEFTFFVWTCASDILKVGVCKVSLFHGFGKDLRFFALVKFCIELN